MWFFFVFTFTVIFTSFAIAKLRSLSVAFTTKLFLGHLCWQFNYSGQRLCWIFPEFPDQCNFVSAFYDYVVFEYQALFFPKLSSDHFLTQKHICQRKMENQRKRHLSKCVIALIQGITRPGFHWEAFSELGLTITAYFHHWSPLVNWRLEKCLGSCLTCCLQI